MHPEPRNDLVIVLAGEAGQGIQAIETIMTVLLKKSGYHLFATKEYMSRVRGGMNSTEIRIGSSRTAALSDRIDLLIPLEEGALPHLSKRISPDTLIIADKATVDAPGSVDIPLTAIASSLGNAIYANIVAVGLICALLALDEAVCEAYIAEYFAGKAEAVRLANRDALRRGRAKAGKISGRFSFNVKNDPAVREEMMISGAEAIAMGALAGGCDYVCGYPMSPSTSVLERMAVYSENFNVIVEQVEDEIGVVNMALGAWYAGARALVTTSGGGFALMSEGLSLCGMIESPLVIHLAQRPGPATGLPTRTEQGDLNLALYAGHGDFPRVILAPGNLQEGFDCMRKAFALADAWQIPVFVLTDQYFVDSYYNTPKFTVPETPPRKHIVPTTADYRRFALTADGISPRGVPGNGEGIVCVDSDEHTEAGYITEDAGVRVRMTDKRLSKAMGGEPLPPTRSGSPSGQTLIVCWGSTREPVIEACKAGALAGVTVLHFPQVFPLPANLAETLASAKTVIAVENNATGQFADLIRQTTGFEIRNRILKYDGHAFSVEELRERISAALKAGTK